MAKKKKPCTASTPETDPITPNPDLPQEEQEGALPEEANPVGGMVETNPPAPVEADPAHVNLVDTPPTGTEIVLSGGDQGVPDVTIEEPTYPAYEWQEAAEGGLVVPNNDMTDEDIVALILGRQGTISFRLKRDLEDYWVIGAGLNVLYNRHAVEKIGPDGKPIPSRWRSHWLPKLRINHTSDQQLRVFAEKFTLAEVGQFGSKTEALRACGFSIGGVTKAIEHAKTEAAQPGAEAEVKTQPVAKTRPEPKVQAKATPENRIAAKAAPQAEPLEKDPVDGTEALVVTLEGAGVSEIEPIVAESGFTLVAKTQDKLVGMMWYGQEKSFETARQRVHLAVGRLRDEKKKLKVEAHYLSLSEVIPV